MGAGASCVGGKPALEVASAQFFRTPSSDLSRCDSLSYEWDTLDEAEDASSKNDANNAKVGLFTTS